MNKLRSLCEKWEREATESREESGRIRRTVYVATEAEANCQVRAELWDKNSAELRAILPDVERLIKELRWARDYIQDGLERPIHACEYNSNPEKGACDFCEKWADIEVMLDQPVAPKETK